jgi:anaerobic magnesium-protoporphyrin IX monomethyl ester cyclase
MALGMASLERASASQTPALALLHSGREIPAMIVLLHPRATRPKNRRFPLAILSIAAMLEGREEYTIVDGNLDTDPGATLAKLAASHEIELLAVSVMPGPQMVAAIALCRDFKARCPRTPIVWGGYFPSLYSDAALNARYVDFVVRGQGEDTLTELLSALRSRKGFTGIRGLSFKDDFGLHVHNADRPPRSPGDFPALPYHRLGNIERYLLPTYLGRRTAVHQTSIGCPYRCQFCGVVPIYDGRQKTEPPARTHEVLADLRDRYRIDAVQFYDNNFFLNESHALAQAEAFEPLGLRWWAEGRIDAFGRYSDSTLRAIRRSGAKMIFFGAESGSDAVLAAMNKKLTAQQTLDLAKRIREFDIVPEFSFVLGNPANPEEDTRQTIDFIRRIKQLNPEAEIIVQHYIPTPHPDGMYGAIDSQIEFPQTPEEWASDRWLNFTIRQDPHLPWLPSTIKQRIDNFEIVINSRWPTIQDIQIPQWGRVLLRSLSAWRYALGVYEFPFELQWAQKFVALRKPRWESL